MAASLGTRPLYTTGKSELDDRVFSTFYEGFQVGKDIANQRGEGQCLGYRADRGSDYQWVSYDDVRSIESSDSRRQTRSLFRPNVLRRKSEVE